MYGVFHINAYCEPIQEHVRNVVINVYILYLIFLCVDCFYYILN